MAQGECGNVSPTAVSSITTRLIEGMYYLIFSFPRSGYDRKCSIDFRHSICNASRIQWKLGNRRSVVIGNWVSVYEWYSVKLKKLYVAELVNLVFIHIALTRLINYYFVSYISQPFVSITTLATIFIYKNISKILFINICRWPQPFYNIFFNLSLLYQGRQRCCLLF